jgi:hypothetical protein
MSEHCGAYAAYFYVPFLFLGENIYEFSRVSTVQLTFFRLILPPFCSLSLYRAVFRIRIHLLRDGSESGSFYHQAKILRKILIPTVL